MDREDSAINAASSVHGSLTKALSAGNVRTAVPITIPTWAPPIGAAMAVESGPTTLNGGGLTPAFLKNHPGI